MRGLLIRQRTFALWWDTAVHVTCKEAQGTQATPAGFAVRAAGLLVADLGVLQVGGDVFEAEEASCGIKP